MRYGLSKKIKGFSLAEVIVVMFIVAVVFSGFYSTFMIGSKYIIDSKNRLEAVALANGKMETIRNLAYEDIGLQGGVAPVGNILQDEDIISGGHQFHVYTQIEYYDDPYDGLAINNEDLIPNDYKIVRIVVSWQGGVQAQEVASVSRFVPPGLETSLGGAPLIINVANSEGISISQASVHIVNNSVSPAINTNMQTNSEGHILFPSAPASIGGYQFTITKSGYEEVYTMSPTATFTPIYQNASVVMGSLNNYSYIQNKLSNLTIKTVDCQNNTIGNVEFTIEGGKIIGCEYCNDNYYYKDVFSLQSETGTTGETSGEKKYSNISPGNYTVTMSSNDQYEFIDFNPSVSPMPVNPGSDESYVIKVADKEIESLFLKIFNSEGNPIADASVTMTDSSNNEIFSGKKSSLRGVVFYPDENVVLLAGEYNLKIEATGFKTENTTVTIDGLTEKSVQLTNN
ncbi:MAG TPA: prepilin-type N-terminal cleavage/methylation domain-containing protein [Candidatus Moranbacteria bacterium]|nr:prepilin-type N-terminal cleavage/methylation domain-containing protein [Candidatus Moranbacteria bacterium]HRZ33623.1 prepilin-type N-terminal cleavage/methylation domain-containing protein [Candidatus Moranbacteria bacterium]